MVDQSPDWIIIDFMCHWVIDTAQESQIPVMYFSVFSSVTNVFAGPPEYVTEEGRNECEAIHGMSNVTPTLGQFPFFSGTKMTLLEYLRRVVTGDDDIGEVGAEDEAAEPSGRRISSSSIRWKGL
ncbi:hypothetical protein K1719_019082 [Acacia pycnantha]|nr:hypothetical protein K1719_019082 [Acacia pycnantha]